MIVLHRDITGKDIPDIRQVKVPIDLSEKIHEVLNPGHRVRKGERYGKKVEA